MSAPADPWRAVRVWLRKAEEDLAACEDLQRIGNAAWIVAFHAQQAIEKYLKALLAARSIPFSKTHDLGELLAILPKDVRPQLDEAIQRKLTYYATAGRYGEDPASVVEDSVSALAAARDVRAQVRRHLPTEALGDPRG